MTVKKTQQTLNTTLEKTEQSLNGLETALENNVGAHPVREGGEVNDGLPEGWAHSTIKDINFYRSGNVKPSDFAGELFDLYSVPIFPENRPEKVYGKEIGSSKQLVETGDVLLCKINPRINRVWSVGDNTGNRLLASSEWIVVRQSQLSKNYLIRFFQSSGFRDLLCSDVSGVGGSLTRARPKIVETYIVPLPPLAEQTVIAQTLDTLLAQVDNIKTRLDAIPKILKTFRQSVLAAAVSGKLTEAWRGENEYSESELGIDFPSSWKMQSIGDCAEVKGGKRLPKGEELLEEDTGFRYIRAGQLKNGTVISGDAARNKQLYLKAEVQEQIKRYTVASGDAYLTIVGASIGDAGIIPESYDGANLTENAAKICEYKRPMCKPYIGYWLRSRIIQDLIKLEIKSGAQGKLALKRIKTLPIPEISLQEQIQIVHRVEELFTFADQIEQQVKNAQGRVNNLTQSILAKAFRGELTAQWRAEHPDLITGDNSAEALLAKIKAERENLKLKPNKKNSVNRANKKARVKRKTINNKNSQLSAIEQLLIKHKTLNAQEIFEYLSSEMKLIEVFSEIASLLESKSIVELDVGGIKTYTLNI